MKNKYIIIIFSFIMFCGITVCGFSNSVSASKSEYRKTSFDVKWSEHNNKMTLDENGNVFFYQVEEDAYDVQNNKYYNNIYTFSYQGNDSSVKAIATLACHDDYVKYVEPIGKAGNILVVSNSENNKSCNNICIYDSSGNVVSSYSDDLGNNNPSGYGFSFGFRKDNILYYVYNTNTGSSRIRSIDVYGGNVIKEDEFKIKLPKNTFIAKTYNQRLYVMTNNYSIISYTLDGRKKVTYKLPKLERYVEIGNGEYTRREDFCVKGINIYYTNGKDGIYCCKLKDAGKKFKLVFNTKKDSYFKNNTMYDLCVKNNKTFYARFIKKGMDGDYGDPTVLVKYVKKR